MDFPFRELVEENQKEGWSKGSEGFSFLKAWGQSFVGFFGELGVGVASLWKKDNEIKDLRKTMYKWMGADDVFNKYKWYENLLSSGLGLIGYPLLAVDCLREAGSDLVGSCINDNSGKNEGISTFKNECILKNFNISNKSNNNFNNNNFNDNNQNNYEGENYENQNNNNLNNQNNFNNLNNGELTFNNFINDNLESQNNFNKNINNSNSFKVD